MNSLVRPADLLVLEEDTQAFLPDNFVTDMGFDPRNISTEDANQLCQYAFAFFRPMVNGLTFGREMEGAIYFVMGELERVVDSRFYKELKYKLVKSSWLEKPTVRWQVIQICNDKLIVSFTN